MVLHSAYLASALPAEIADKANKPSNAPFLIILRIPHSFLKLSLLCRLGIRMLQRCLWIFGPAPIGLAVLLPILNACQRDM